MTSISPKKQKPKKWTVTILAIVILIVIPCFSAYAQSETSGAISIWHFKENHGCNISDEMSINTGKLKPDCPSNSPRWVRGRIGYALEFDGVDDYLDLGTYSSLGGLIDFTVEAWIKTTSKEQVIIQQRDDEYNGEYQLWINPDGTILWVTYGDNEYGFNFNSKKTVNDGNWHHIISTRKNGEGYIYIDGSLDNSQKATSRNLDKNIKVAIGKDIRDGGRHFTGIIDEVGIYNRALTPAEIKTRYQKEVSSYLEEANGTSNASSKITNITLKTKQMRDFINKTTKDGNITKTSKKEDEGITILGYFLLFWLIITVFFGLILLWLGRGWRIREDEIMSINLMSIKTLLKFGLSTGILLRLYTITSILWIVFWVGFIGFYTIDRILSHLDTSNFVFGVISLVTFALLPALILLYIVLYLSVQQKQRKVREREEERRRQEEEERRREEEERKKDEEKERKRREFKAKKEKLRDLEHDYIRNFVKKYREAIYEYKRYVMERGGYDIEEYELFYEDIKEFEYTIALKNLRTVLSKKGIDFSESEIETFINEELERQEYNEFRDKILQRNPKDINEYIRSFLDCYGESYSDSELHYLKLLLGDTVGPVENLKQKIEDIKKKIELERFEKRLTEGSTKRVTISEIDSMSGYDFERFLEKLFKRMGYSVTHTKLTGDQGGDLILSKFGDKIAVQAKRSENPIGNKAVQEVLGAMKMYNCNKGMVVTNNKFTTSARGLAIKSNVELVDRNKLKDWIKDYM